MGILILSIILFVVHSFCFFKLFIMGGKELISVLVIPTPSPPPARFRHQHEQLQAVIVRVLRPPSAGAQPTAQSTSAPDHMEPALETDDLSAVREVKLAYENVKVVDCLDLSPEGCAAWEAALKRYVCG